MAGEIEVLGTNAAALFTLQASTAVTRLELQEPPAAGQIARWLEDYTVPIKIRDRELFS